MQQVTCTDNLSEEAVPVFASHYLNQALWFDNVSESENTSLSLSQNLAFSDVTLRQKA